MEPLLTEAALVSVLRPRSSVGDTEDAGGVSGAFPDPRLCVFALPELEFFTVHGRAVDEINPV